METGRQRGVCPQGQKGTEQWGDKERDLIPVWPGDPDEDVPETGGIQAKESHHTPAVRALGRVLAWEVQGLP